MSGYSTAALPGGAPETWKPLQEVFEPAAAEAAAD
jgi:hypothetical protein